MPGFLYNVGAIAACPHAGQITVMPGQARVFVGVAPVATVADFAAIAGCTFAPGGAASPCVSVRWLVPATRVFINGQPALLSTSSGLCQNAAQAPQGAPIIIGTQSRVSGT
jgi:hypothetical protein